MKSLAIGKNISINNTVTAITNLGFYLLIDDREYFISFSEYPMFKHAPVDFIYDIEMLSPRQLYWKKIDCDIELDALENPEKYTLVYKY